MSGVGCWFGECEIYNLLVICVTHAKLPSPGRDLPLKDTFDRVHVQNDVGIFIPRRRAGLPTAAG